ncbi:MAG: hypothetical protein LBR61_09985 [Synergistaceae bacterium]|jgi:hypothetical protein|nr:hypothetical protein [Synergistaceae bacterium]
MHTYQAYCEKGRIVPVGNPVIPEGRKIIITVLDEGSDDQKILRRLNALAEFRREIRASVDEPLGPEFDEIAERRVNITREVDL